MSSMSRRWPSAHTIPLEGGRRARAPGRGRRGTRSRRPSRRRRPGHDRSRRPAPCWPGVPCAPRPRGVAWDASERYGSWVACATGELVQLPAGEGAGHALAACRAGHARRDRRRTGRSSVIVVPLGATSSGSASDGFDHATRLASTPVNSGSRRRWRGARSPAPSGSIVTVHQAGVDRLDLDPARRADTAAAAAPAGFAGGFFDDASVGACSPDDGDDRRGELFVGSGGLRSSPVPSVGSSIVMSVAHGRQRARGIVLPAHGERRPAGRRRDLGRRHHHRGCHAGQRLHAGPRATSS